MSRWSDADIATVRRMVAEGATGETIGKVVGRSSDAVYNLGKRFPDIKFNGRWSGRSGEVPADFLDHAYERIADLRKRYHATYAMVIGWRAEHGITTKMVLAANAKPRPLTPMPEGFLEYQQGRSVREIAKHYGMAVKTVSRMLIELGIDRQKQYAAARAERKAAKPAKPTKPKSPYLISFDRSSVAMAPKDYAYRENSAAGEAAAYLQPDYIPTYRCDDEGRQNISGRFWRCGRRVAITDAEIIELAATVRERKSRRLAA